MISVSTLKESIYQPSYFSESVGTLTVTNKEEKTAARMLASVEMRTQGTFIKFDNSILKDGNDIYQKEDREKGRISFRRDCDGICLLEVGSRKLLLVIEVKSGYNEIKKKGVEQLVASYVKIRSILQSIDGYNPADYEEMGLLISYPPTGTRTVPEKSILETKKAMIMQTALDKLNNAKAAELGEKKEVVLDLTDYYVDACHVNPTLYNPSLHVKHIEVTDMAESETINLDAYL